MGRIVITGGAGFVGSHLAERLLREGREVVVLDNLITGNLENLASFAGSPAFTFREQNVSDPFTVDGAVDAIYHMASPASPPRYQEHPIETLRVGSIGTMNALELAAAKDCPVLVASTSEVYGDPPKEQHPQRETYWGNVNPIGVRSCYDEAKRFTEATTMSYHRARGVKTRIVRIFNTYGPRMDPEDGRVLPNFVCQALRGEPLTVYGEGRQTRSFCFVEDLVDGIIRLMNSDEVLPVNIGNDGEFTILQFAEMIIELTGSTSSIVYRDLPQDDPMQRRPDLTRAREILGWQPKVALRDGLLKTIPYFERKVQESRDS